MSQPPPPPSTPALARRAVVPVAFTLLLAACPPPPSGGDGGALDAGAPRRDGGSVTPNPDGGSFSAPSLLEATAQVAGRRGRDLRFTVRGKDRDLDIAGVWVRFLDGSGAALGVPGELFVPLDTKKYVGETLTGEATLKRFLDGRDPIAKAGLALLDGTSQYSEERVMDVTPLPVAQQGELCDTAFRASRCADGLGCRGAPSTCQEGTAPQLTRFAYVRVDGGEPYTLLEGTEAEDDLAVVRFQFQAKDGGLVSIDSDGDGSPDLPSFDYDAYSASVDGAFFLRVNHGLGLDEQAPRLVLTPVDGAGHEGTSKVAALSTVPSRATGQSCDPRGFDVCASGLVCNPGVVGAASNVCASGATLRTQQCGAAPVLLASASGGSLLGRAEGGSLWDAPAGCSSGDPKGRPEGLVKVRLAERANRLVVSTVRPGTTFDTTLYVLDGCPASSVDAYACNDDAPEATGRSEVALADVPAGDYLVVVDSFDMAGGTFELSAKVE